MGAIAKRKPKLTGEQRLAVKDAQGSLRELAIQYGVSHEEIRRIKSGARQPFPRERPPKVPRWESHKTPVGTVVRVRLLRPSSDGQYWIKLELSAIDAAPLIDVVEKTIRAEADAIARDGDDGEPADWPDEYDEDDDLLGEYGDTEVSEARPYARQEGGAYVLSFKTVKPYPKRKPVRPPLTNAKGGTLRKPERIAVGSRVSVTFAVVPWHRPFSSQVQERIKGARRGRGKADFSHRDHTGVGALLSLQGVTLIAP
jgi:hypothetical protein